MFTITLILGLLFIVLGLLARCYPNLSNTFSSTDVDTLYLTNQMPAIRVRTNGYATQSALKGNFRFDDWGKCKLFIHQRNTEAIVMRCNGQYIIFNSRNEQTTADYYCQLRNAWLAAKE